jgi:hypothetical protein
MPTSIESEENSSMSNPSADRRSYLVAVLLGAVIGGVIVAIMTKAIPKIMSQLMSKMMSEMPQKMMAQMKAEGIDPAEMCQRMMANFNQPQSKSSPTEQGHS